MNKEYLEKILKIINKLSQLSESEKMILFELLLTTTSFGLVKIINCNMDSKEMKEDFKFNIQNEIISTREILEIQPKIEEYELLKKTYGISIVKFTRKLQEHFSEYYLRLLYNNITKLNIEQKKKNHFEKNTLAHYDVIENKIYFKQGTFFENIYHELFHVASYDKEHNLCGFNQIDIGIGLGLNEGYTALLTERYFNGGDSGYSYEKGLARNIEIIIGQSKMEKFYLTADLYSIVKELTKYQTESNIKNLLVDLDFICKYKNKLKQNKHKKLMFQKKCYETHKLLLETYMNKIVEEYNCNLDDDKIKQSKIFFENLNVSFVIDKREFKVMPASELENLINTLFKNNNMTYTVTADEMPKLKRPYSKKLTK